MVQIRAIEKDDLRAGGGGVTQRPPEGKGEQLKRFERLLPESQGQNLALTVLCVPCWPCATTPTLVTSPHGGPEGRVNFQIKVRKVSDKSLSNELILASH